MPHLDVRAAEGDHGAHEDGEREIRLPQLQTDEVANGAEDRRHGVAAVVKELAKARR